MLAALLLAATAAHAGGSTIDRVYHPYVDPMERELEWRATHASEDPASGQRRAEQHVLGFGAALSDSVFAELYVSGERASDEALSLEGYATELLWQLTEQGEYAADFGALFELEKRHGENAWQAAGVLLVEREFGRFSATANLGLIREWGERLRDRWETSAALQARYRYAPLFEPALEFYAGENTRGLGPVILGRQRFGSRRSLSWELGVILGLDDDTADHTWRLALEFEF
ncbi:hypothetical protein E4634_03800 [Mangrovimicrobium sediminis]|uniref:Copper resistance protein B n=1 Tax=Mangrovimicrobium sediminis TaxID=2562682 RepID=A0A4Z0M7G8_9GAMM|nr:hypothetical protein E4634_03800 [Haliea sp. SAOS-164]